MRTSRSKRLTYKPSRRELVFVAGLGVVSLASISSATAASPNEDTIVPPAERFPHFKSTPVPYFNINLNDRFWAPRQRVIRDKSVQWATRHWDASGGLEAFRANPTTYKSQIRRGDLEAVKFVESMSAVVGVERDQGIEGLIDSWGRKLIEGQTPDGYFAFGWPLGADPLHRWEANWISHEDYSLGNFIESGIAYEESTGKNAIYHGAVRAADNMVEAFERATKSYAPGHEEIEQALMRLYGKTGERKYLRLCGWLIDQRGRHEGRASYGAYSQDNIPVADQRTIEGHAVRAAFLYNGVTEYIGATGDARYRDAVIAVWRDFCDHKMFLSGAGGLISTHNEGYGSRADHIPPNDCYGESCSVFGNFQWAHNLFRLTGEASYLDVAERMLYNAFYASLSLQGDSYFYQNVMQQDDPTGRHQWHPVPCCPPNIVKLFAKIGGYFYSVDDDGVFLKHYGASEADIPFGDGVRLIQRGDYPWNGDLEIEVRPRTTRQFTLRLRVPAWAKTHNVRVNGRHLSLSARDGWVSIRRTWQPGDRVEISLEMEVRRVTMPAQFADYQGLVAFERGPIVYCLEEQDVERSTFPLALAAPPDTELLLEHDPNLLGGITVLRANLASLHLPGGDERIRATFIPYGVWNNRDPGWMRVWLSENRPSIPANPPGPT